MKIIWFRQSEVFYLLYFQNLEKEAKYVRIKKKKEKMVRPLNKISVFGVLVRGAVYRLGIYIFSFLKKHRPYKIFSIIG